MNTETKKGRTGSQASLPFQRHADTVDWSPAADDPEAGGIGKRAGALFSAVAVHQAVFLEPLTLKHEGYHIADGVKFFTMLERQVVCNV